MGAIIIILVILDEYELNKRMNNIIWIETSCDVSFVLKNIRI